MNRSPRHGGMENGSRDAHVVPGASVMFLGAGGFLGGRTADSSFFRLL